MSKAKEIKIETISIKLGDKSVSLTLEEAKELKRELVKLFPEPITTIYPMPYTPAPVRPYYYETTYTGDRITPIV